MSSTLSIYGTLQFPPGALATWRGMPLDPGEAEPDEHGEIEGTFDQPCEETTVAEILDCDDDRYHFVHLALEGDALHVRAALGDDTWAPWCGRLAALARAAAKVQARGYLETEDDGFYTGCLTVEDGHVFFEPRSLHRQEPTDKTGAADHARLWQEEIQKWEAEAAARKAKQVAKKKTAKKTAAKKTAAKKTAAKKTAAASKTSPSKKVATKKTATKKTATRKTATRKTPAKKAATKRSR